MIQCAECNGVGQYVSLPGDVITDCPYCKGRGHRALRVDEVRLWVVQSGIGHVVLADRGGWVTTACIHWMTGTSTPDRPRRICRACRKALPGLRFAEADIDHPIESGKDATGCDI